MTDPAALAREVYAAINAQDIAALDRLFDPGIVRHARGEVGIEAARRAVVDAFAGAPGLRFTVEDAFGAGDRAAVRVTVDSGSGSGSGSQGTILEIFRFEDGRVAEIWGAGTGG